MRHRTKVGIIFGGRSAEHEVSLRSASTILNALDREKYEPILIGINKSGEWLMSDSAEFIVHSNDPKRIRLNLQAAYPVTFVPQSGGRIIFLNSNRPEVYINVAFPILHGPFGEDGTIQGLLKLVNIPFVGAGVLGSAVGMDKDVMKRLLQDAGISIGKFLVFRKNEETNFKEVARKLGMPFFVKPANMGSSVGVNKVTSEEEFDMAIKEAFKYDTKIIVEENIAGREIECSILGNDDLIASVPGEVVSHNDFYSYQTKYLDNSSTTLTVPADLSDALIKDVQMIAIKAFKALCCEGLGRIDFFIKKNNEVLVNEINTLPGFTPVSMYPKLWEASGISYTELIDRLIQLAIERFKNEKDLKTSV